MFMEEGEVMIFMGEFGEGAMWRARGNLIQNRVREQMMGWERRGLLKRGWRLSTT